MIGLLATIVASRHLPPEPVATDALVHLCTTSKAAASVLADLLVELCPGTSTSGLSFTGQEINPETEGRPDLVASDSTGTRLVLEAKFDAVLTPAQTGGAYVEKLGNGPPGGLVFLVPRDRMRNVWRTISVTPGGAKMPVDLPSNALDSGIAAMALETTGHVLAVLSWESLLTRMSAATAKFGDHAGSVELAQIEGLVRWRTGAGWIPLVPEDLPPRVGRQLRAVNDVIKAVCPRVSPKKVRNGSGDGGFGRHITTPSGKSLWIGTWLNWWDIYGPGPAWVHISLKSTQETAFISETLTSADIAHYARQQYNDVIIALDLPLGAERGTVAASVIAQVEAVITAIDTLSVEVVEGGSDQPSTMS